MQAEPKPDNRQVIPRWRSVNNTSKAELRSSSRVNAHDSHDQNTLFEYELLKGAWADRNSIETAAELVAAGIVFGPSSEADRAAHFIQQNRDSVDSVVKLALAYSRGPREVGVPDAFDENLAEPRIEISRLRRRIHSFPRNAILYSEIARQYLILGQRNKSREHMERALYLRPTNRLLLRNFARLSVHLLKPELGISKLSEIPKGDVWIDAALAALLDLEQEKRSKRYSPRQLLNLDFNPQEITELLSAYGTFEIRSGNSKMGRKLLHKSASGANDNTVAQLQWSSEKFGLEFDSHLLDVERSFEARANAASVADNWNDAISNANNWSIDEPFSERPFVFGSYVAAEQLWDYKAAKRFAKRGLISNPDSPILLNNLAFSEAMLGNLVEAKSILDDAQNLVKLDEDLPANLATCGLIAFRSGDPEEGRIFYKKAIDKAIELKRKSTMELAYLHLLMEEIRLSNAISETQFNLLTKHFSDDGEASPATKKVFDVMRHRLFENKVRDVGFEGLSIPLLSN